MRISDWSSDVCSSDLFPSHDTMGYRGRFSVQSVDDKGILAWSTEKDGGYCHIYMGPTYHDKNTGLRKTSHTLLKIKRKEEV